MQEGLKIDDLDKIGQRIIVSYDKEFDIKTESEKKESVLFLKFDADGQVCHVMSKKYGIDTKMTYHEGDEIMLVTKAMNLRNSAVKSKQSEDMLLKVTSVFLIAPLVITAFAELAIGDYVLALNALMIAVTVSAHAINRFIKNIDKSALGTIQVVTGWSCFLNSMYILGIMYVVMGMLDVYRDNKRKAV